MPALAAYLVVIILATLTPFAADFNRYDIYWRLMRAAVPRFNRGDIVDAARNVILFGGLGLVWMATAPRGGAWREVRKATLCGFVISASVEFLQLFAWNRFSSINDIITNTAGALLGAVSFAIVVSTLLRHRERKSYFGLPAMLLAISYGIGAGLEALIPLFRDSLGRLSGGPVSRALLVLDTFNWNSVLDFAWADIPLYAAAGLLAAVALVESGLSHPDAARRTIVVGVLLSILIELLHAPLGIPIILGSLLARIIGLTVGAWGTGHWLSWFSNNVRGVDRPRILLAGYALVLVLWAWRPYVPEFNHMEYVRKLHDPWWIPLAMTGRWNNFYAIFDIAVPFFLGVPIGALLAVWPLRRHGPLRTALPGIYLVFVLEAGQLFVVGRSPDITDFLVAAAGVAMGWLCLRRAGFQPYGEVLRTRDPLATS
jgi:glycopeptide antibiotics resistance protein